MKIGVVGTFIRDRIFPWQARKPASSIGGIFFSVSYLANLAEPTMTIYPVANVGDDLYEALTRELAGYGNVRFEGLHRLPRANTQVKLVYTGPQQRYEITTEPMPPLRLTDLELLLDADAVLVNLITGSDLDLEALRSFRRRSRGLIYLDFHSHALGIDAEGKRYYRRPADWRAWIEAVDVLQVNEQEAQTLAGFERHVPYEALVPFGLHVLELGPSVCHITLAEAGSLLFTREQGRARWRQLPGLRLAEVVDVIGCGDAFAAGYLVHCLTSGDPVAATELAIEVSALNCTFIGSSGVKTIRQRLHKRLTGVEPRRGTTWRT